MGRQADAEAALQGRPLTTKTLVAALRALHRGLGGGGANPLNVQMAEGVLLAALGPLILDKVNICFDQVPLEMSLLNPVPFESPLLSVFC